MTKTYCDKAEIREMLITKATRQLECLEEDMPPEGNASAIDGITDKQIIRTINAKLQSGDRWAWCCVKVTVAYAGLDACEYLDCCSYKDEANFKHVGPYDDMVSSCLDQLTEQVWLILETFRPLDKGIPRD